MPLFAYQFLLNSISLLHTYLLTLTILTLVLLLLEICRGFFLIPFSRDGNKFITWLGVIIFSLWLLWDVDFLLNQSEKINDWNSATQIAYFPLRRYCQSHPLSSRSLC